MTEPLRKKLRRAQLSGSWYPGKKSQVLKEIDSWESYLETPELSREFVLRKERDKVLAMVPHAGWFFSGRLAAKTLKAAEELFGEKGPSKVVVLGGHMPPGRPMVNYSEDEWETPLDPAPLTPELNQRLSEITKGSLEFRTWTGDTNDNTIEVELPLVRRFFPEASVMALRVVPDSSSEVLGKALLELFRDEKTLFIASTDLTHYGYAYDFCPAGPGSLGEKYRERNDRNFIEAALALDFEEMLKLGNDSRAACCSGAAGAVASIAKEIKAEGFLLDYYSSTDILPGDQSVGYAGIAYAPK
jgi:AmmeMemoRadiSam system protein B